MKITLLNPYSVELKKHPFMEMRNEPVYRNGEYAIYHYTNQHFVHTFKNIVICERGAKNTDLIDRLVADIKPEGEAAIYHDYERPKAAMMQGIKAAKKLNFTIK